MRIIRRSIFLIILLFLSAAYGQDRNDETSFLLESDQLKAEKQWYHRFGDNPDWTFSDFAEVSREKVPIYDHKREHRGVHWYQTKIRLLGNPVESKTLTVRVVGLSVAYEVYWDGKLIGRNGQVGTNKDDEIPGLAHYLIKLEKKMTTPGKHYISIRLSDFRGQNFFPGSWVIISYLTDWQARVSKRLYTEFFVIGIYLMTVVLSLALYLGGGRHRSFLFFGLYCLLSAMAYSVASIIEYGNFKITVLDYLFGIQQLNILLSPILWVIFLVFHFKLPGKLYHIGITSLVVVFFRFVYSPPGLGFDLDSLIILFYAFGLLVYAVTEKKSGGFIALMGMLFLLFPNIMGLIQLIFHIPFPRLTYEYFSVPFLFCIILSISRQIKEENRTNMTTLKHSFRLETELLKKTIQPHFMMNTLLSIISLIGENPGKAVKLIKALAAEFRMINKIASEKEIPLQAELDLCRTHLELMGYRMDATFELIIESTCDQKTIPPMIFQTMVENGLTHAFKAGENGKFWFTCKKHKNQVLYSLRNNGSLLKLLSHQNEADIEEGMGFKYIRARLEECYSSRWKLHYGFNHGQWEVTITVKE
ncbi:MAG: histidine kinase [Candidatus Aminicenantes bacterium]|nr:histidine kinase [Candidatus Aminicenantes bacterium]